MQGNGIGQVVSAETADLCLFYRAEESRITPVNLAAHHIHLYARYRDDILIVADADHRQLLQSFISSFTRAASPTYKVAIEGLFDVEVDFLDITISPDRGRLQYKPHIKNTSQKRPLSSDSAHRESIHRSWPQGQLLRLCRRSSSRKHYEVAKTIFLAKLKQFFFNPMYLVELAAWVPCNSHSSKTHDPESIWLVLPYHVGIRTGAITRALSVAVEKWHHTFLQLGFRVVPQISWRNSTPNLLALTRRCF